MVEVSAVVVSVLTTRSGNKVKVKVIVWVIPKVSHSNNNSIIDSIM